MEIINLQFIHHEHAQKDGQYILQIHIVIVCINMCISESLLCHSTAVEVFFCLVLYCVGDLNPLPAELPWYDLPW